MGTVIETRIGGLADPRERFRAFVQERMRIFQKRQRGLPAPWTDDPILMDYKFCNVRREDDTVTGWIRKNWRVPNYNDPDLWFAMVVARFINWPETLEDLNYPVPWSASRFLMVMAERKRRKLKSYTGAYMVRADREHKDKAAYQEEVVFTPMWNARERLRPKEGDTLRSYHVLLGQFHGLGSFMAAQVVADLKYVWPLLSASDWAPFAASGPGSRRGLNRVLGRPRDASWSEEDWWLEENRLRADMVTLGVMRDLGEERLHGQDVQNVLCEFDKYERVRLGEGKPRSKFNGRGS